MFDPLDTRMKDQWIELKADREKVMNVSFVIGGVLLITGLICVASQKPTLSGATPLLYNIAIRHSHVILALGA